MDYFTSDLHIGHDKNFIWQSRGFSSVAEHDREILKRWNSVVTDNDTVYILGDLCMSADEKEWNTIFKNLTGNKIFIRGNHDTDNKMIKYIKDYNMKYLGMAYLFHYSKKKKFLLTHYPTLVGNYKDPRFFWNLSGHTHSQDKFQYSYGNVYNVALDAHNCYPVSIEQIIKDIEKFTKEANV